MANLQYPNRDWIQMQMDRRLADALDSIQGAINTLGEKLGASPVGPTPPPPSVSALNLAKRSDGTLQAQIQDHTPIQWGIHYFLEYSQTPNFEQPHVIHLGQSRNWVGPDISSTFPHWRTYSMYPGQQVQSQRIAHNGKFSSENLTSTGSGTASGNGRQGGQGFGTVPLRTPPQRNPIAVKS